jgi:hypothetical protein
MMDVVFGLEALEQFYGDAPNARLAPVPPAMRITLLYLWNVGESAERGRQLQL